MNQGQKKTRTIDEYIKSAPKQAQKHLKEIRTILKKAAPGATEGIKWRAPIWEYHRILYAIYAYKDHLNFMPTPLTMKSFTTELAKYDTGKGTVKFSYDKPLPERLIAKMAKQRVKELKEKDAKWM